jgi:hypothetical protein
MTHETTCKFCHKPIFLTVDDSYPALKDPYKLFTLAACNACADRRERRRNIEEHIRKVCLNFMASNCDPSEAPKARNTLEILTKKYTALVAEWVGSTTPWWDREIVDTLIEKPKHVASVLSMCWRRYEDNNQQRVQNSFE